MQSEDIATRLAALEARVPAGNPPPGLPRRNRRARVATPFALAAPLSLALVATVAAGGVVLTSLVGAHPGVENPGQPLEGAGLECMTPPQAAAYLAQRGFVQVDWQVESGAAGGKTGTTVHQAVPPDHGFVVPGTILDDGSLIMVIDQRAGATGSGACPDMAMP